MVRGCLEGKHRRKSVLRLEKDDALGRRTESAETEGEIEHMVRPRERIDGKTKHGRGVGWGTWGKATRFKCSH